MRVTDLIRGSIVPPLDMKRRIQSRLLMADKDVLEQVPVMRLTPKWHREIAQFIADGHCVAADMDSAI